ncbi:MAG: Gfo/Idh/MocA family oxidoreductase [Ignavibacteriaceae bacterium]|nr:Gfo/Idh/MocA family oxidoreductase [Ignavibacteriaceae bacterium]
MKIGIIGLGYWGPNLVRNFLGNKLVEKVIACDLKEDRLAQIKSKFPGITVTNNYKELLDSDIDAVAIATSVNTHYNLAKEALEAGKHIWVEKPFTSSSQQAKDLIKIAESKKLNIFVDHTFLYTGAVIKIKELIDNGELGDILYFDSVRINLGLFQHDVNVIWDLAPHDLSIMKHVLVGKEPIAVTASGISSYNCLENIAQMSVHFKDNSCFAHFHVNWTSPVKIRKIMIAGKKKMLVFNDLEYSEKIKIYDSGVEFDSTESIHNALVQYRTGDMYSPQVGQSEALTSAVSEFINSILEKRKPLTDGQNGLEVVEILEASQKSIKKRGTPVYLNDNSEFDPLKQAEINRSEFTGSEVLN